MSRNLFVIMQWNHIVKLNNYDTKKSKRVEVKCYHVKMVTFWIDFIWSTGLRFQRSWVRIFLITEGEKYIKRSSNNYKKLWVDIWIEKKYSCTNNRETWLESRLEKLLCLCNSDCLIVNFLFINFFINFFYPLFNSITVLATLIPVSM